MRRPTAKCDVPHTSCTGTGTHGCGCLSRLITQCLRVAWAANVRQTRLCANCRSAQTPAGQARPSLAVSSVTPQLQSCRASESESDGRACQRSLQVRTDRLSLLVVIGRRLFTLCTQMHCKVALCSVQHAAIGTVQSPPLLALPLHVDRTRAHRKHCLGINTHALCLHIHTGNALVRSSTAAYRYPDPDRRLQSNSDYESN